MGGDAATLGGGGGGGGYIREEGAADFRSSRVRVCCVIKFLRSRTPQNPLSMLNTLNSVSVREYRIQYLCDAQWFRDTASRGPTTIAAPESQFRTCPTDHDCIGYPRMSASGESSTTMHRLLHASGSHPIPPPNDPKLIPMIVEEIWQALRRWKVNQLAGTVYPLKIGLYIKDDEQRKKQSLNRHIHANTLKKSSLFIVTLQRFSQRRKYYSSSSLLQPRTQ
ncbi:Glycosyl hydrolase family 38 protein isoform 1 [Dorcoceras hygrometricum]|uniref:Glycosyl hydrolase family 38 protein isoform 1 n=1 Tax=Dorcoceras hygrometricum TaxID=472368 RepID=A0A2Z7BWH4_9LAMI|nr:Glycosyl hydrolase family 38 protein isoform 1 [Dorcoceras hygrometricum]